MCVDKLFVQWNPENSVDAKILRFLAEVNAENKEDGQQQQDSADVEVVQADDNTGVHSEL
jgi:ubiquitin-protein ligase